MAWRKPAGSLARMSTPSVPSRRTFLASGAASLALAGASRLAAGAAPEKFKHDGLSFSRIPGRTTYSFDNAPEVITAKSALELAQEAAKAAGLATAKTGAATWRVSAPRS